MAVQVDSAGWFTSDTRSCDLRGAGMMTRTGLISLALMAALAPRPVDQTQKPEILWQFEAGG
jgi:hypothetical protein